MIVTHRLTCSCGWTQDVSSRDSATKWKQWHRRQYTGKCQRLSESGHAVKVTRVDQKS